MVFRLKQLKLKFNKRQLFYSIIAVLFIASLLTSYIKSQSLLNTNGWLVASNPPERYYLKYPSEWKLQEGTGYLLSLVDPKSGTEISLRNISDGNNDGVRRSILERRNNKLKSIKNLPQRDLDFKETKIGENTLFVVREFSTFFAEPGKPEPEESEFQDLGYDLAYVISANKVTKFYSTKDFTDPKIAQVIKTIFSTFKYDGSLDGKNLSFQSKELGINFEYPSELYPVVEHPSSGKWYAGKLSEESKDLAKTFGQNRAEAAREWWLIDFSRERGSISGYLQISAATPRGGPLSWEGNPHWLNEKIYDYDTAEDVKQKLIKGRLKVIKVQKIKNEKNITAFEAWVVNCYVMCSLDRIYILPIRVKNYGSLLIYGVIKDGIAGGWDSQNNPIPVDEKELEDKANYEISKIEKGKNDSNTMKYVRNQDIIFNSLRFE